MVDDSLRVPHRWQPSARNVPGVVWLLLIAAAVQVTVLWLSRSAVTQPLPLASIVGIVSNATSFLLAAAVAVGLRRWPSGRRWLVIGAAAFALIGVLDFGRDIWFAAQPYGNLPVDVTSQMLMRLRGTIVAVLAIVAPILLGIGLWTSRPDPAGRKRVAAVLVVVIVGAAATVGGVLQVSVTFGVAPDPSTPFDAPLLLLTGLDTVGFALLAVAATRGALGSESLPEVLIAAGATLWVAAIGWLHWWSFAWLAAGPPQQMPEGWDVTINVTNGVMLLGTLAIIAGFGSAGLLRARESE
jgi:hypothetical protein